MKCDVILIFENLTGHRTRFINEILEKFTNCEIQFEILILSAYLPSKFENIRNNVKYVKFNSRKELLHYVKNKQTESPDCETLFLDFDLWIFPVLRYQTFNFRALILRPYIHSFSFSSIIRYLVKNLLLILTSIRYPQRIYRLTIPLQKHFFPNRWVTESPVQINPETILSFSDLLLMPKQTYTFLVAGAISKRKKLNDALYIVEKYVDLRKCIANFRIVGVQDFVDFDLHSKKEGVKIDVINRYLEDTEYYKEISSTDFLIALNTNIGSSRTILEGVALGRIVITSKLSRQWKNFQITYKNQVLQDKEFIQLLEGDTSTLVNLIYKRPFFNNLKSEIDRTWLDAMFTQRSGKWNGSSSE